MVYKDQQLCFLVDCGPTSANESPLTGLSKIGFSKLLDETAQKLGKPYLKPCDLLKTGKYVDMT